MDSPQDLFFWGDHFLGDQLKDEWDVTAAGGGTAIVVDQQAGGIVRLASPTNATNDAAQMDWADIRSLHITKKTTIEARMKLNSVASLIFRMRLIFDASNYVEIRYDTNFDATYKIRCVNGGVGAAINSGVTPDTDYHIFRVECFPTDEVHFYYDGVEMSNSPITTNIPDDAGYFLQPYFRCSTREAVEKQLDIDYVVVRQER